MQIVTSAGISSEMPTEPSSTFLVTSSQPEFSSTQQTSEQSSIESQLTTTDNPTTPEPIQTTAPVPTQCGPKTPDDCCGDNALCDRTLSSPKCVCSEGYTGTATCIGGGCRVGRDATKVELPGKFRKLSIGTSLGSGRSLNAEKLKLYFELLLLKIPAYIANSMKLTIIRYLYFHWCEFIFEFCQKEKALRVFVPIYIYL